LTLRVGINGFGRIGRAILRTGWEHPDIEWVAINDPAGPQVLAYLLQYDSTYGRFPGKVEALANTLWIEGKPISLFSSENPADLPWKDLGIDIVIESSARFTDATKARAHLDAGAKRVVISAAAEYEDLTICMGINEDKFDPARHFVISNASCTTNCLAHLARVLEDTFGIRRGFMTTVHMYTNGQRVLDSSHKDLRRARSAFGSIIPTSTGAAKAIGRVIPRLKGRLNGIAVRVPSSYASLIDLTVELNISTTSDEINAAYKRASAAFQRYLEYTDAPLVSRDIVGNFKSCVFDAQSTEVIGGNLVKVLGWYDNESGYSQRMIDLISYIGK
jgi:glyceraldehyde 3-phosphate dehydrogenase